MPFKKGNQNAQVVYPKKSLWIAIKKNRFFYLLIIPGFLYFVIFHYLPMFGIIISFKDVSPFGGIQGIFDSEWVGLKHFKRFFDSYYFWNVLGNTVIISFYKLIFGFPAPIIFALMLNEVTRTYFKRIVQTISYLPHFISLVVLSGLVMHLTSIDGGLINQLVMLFGGDPIFFLGDVKYFRGVLVVSDIWKGVGFGSILYLASITTIDPQLYEAAKIDGANKWRQLWHITLPGMSFVIVVLFIFAIGDLLNAGFEQILLLYSPAVYQVADIIDTYVYREGLIALQYSFATAVGLFKSIIAVFLLVGANYLARRINGQGLW